MVLLIVYLLIALFFSFLCSILEAVVLSIPPSYIEVRLEEDSPLRPDYLRVRDNIDHPISAILTLNTFAHTLGAAGVGAQAQLVWGNEYLSLISALLTILILIFSEIIPKTLGATYWKELTPFSLRTLRLLIWVLYPFVWVSQWLTRLLKKSRGDSMFTRNDLQKMAEVVKREGSIQQDESQIIQNLMRFNQVPVEDIMTPRTVVMAMPEDDTIQQAGQKIDELPFSRIPVYHETIDNVTGFVLRDELLRELTQPNNDKPLSTIARDIHVVPSNMKLLLLMEQLIQQHAHIALVVDEYGGTEGVVTMEDLLESLLGLEIIDETDKVQDMREVARKRGQAHLRNLRRSPRKKS